MPNFIADSKKPREGDKFEELLKRAMQEEEEEDDFDLERDSVTHPIKHRRGSY